MEEVSGVSLFKLTVFEDYTVGDYKPRTNTHVRKYVFPTEQAAEAFQANLGPKERCYGRPEPVVVGPEGAQL